MNISDKLRIIRNRLGFTLDYLAYKIGYTPSHLSRIENGSRTISGEMLTSIKNALDIADVPLTGDEIRSFEQELYDWRDLINAWCLDEASKFRKGLERRAEFSLNKNLLALYHLISIGFFRAVGDGDSAIEVIAKLTSMKEELPLEYRFRLLLMNGTEKIYAHNYKAALYELMEAELLNENLGIANAGLFYNIAICLTDLGYAHKACEYILKARKNEKEVGTSAIQYDITMAINYSRIGRCDEAIKLAKSCLLNEKSRPSQAPITASIYYCLGYVYMKVAAYTDAINNFNKAMEQLEKGGRDYLHALYYMAQSLYLSGKAKESKNYLELGTDLSKEGDVTNVMFNAAIHLMTLEDGNSLEYIEDEALPKILEFDRYMFAIEYCCKLKEFYRTKQKYKTSLKYADMITHYYKKILEGDLT